MRLKLTGSSEKLLADRVRPCFSLWRRLAGLLAGPPLETLEACWLKPCRSVHTFGMRYAIDVCFLDRRNQIVGLARDLRPNRISRYYPSAHSAVEMTAGAFADCRVGDRLVSEEAA